MERAGILPSLHTAKIPIFPATDLRDRGQRIAVLLPESPRGFQHLNAWLSEARPHRLHELPDLPEVRIIYPLSRAPERALKAHEWIGVEEGEQRRAERHPAFQRCLAWTTMAFRGNGDYNSHRLLRAMEQITVLSKLTSADHLPNAHRWEDMSAVAARFSPLLWAQSQYFLDSLPALGCTAWKGEWGEESADLHRIIG